MSTNHLLRDRQQIRLSAVPRFESLQPRVTTDHSPLLPIHVMTWLAQADRVKVPDALATAQQVVYRSRRSGMAVQQAGDAAYGGYGVHPRSLFLRWRALSWLCGRLWEGGHTISPVS